MSNLFDIVNPFSFADWVVETHSCEFIEFFSGRITEYLANMERQYPHQHDLEPLAYIYRNDNQWNSCENLKKQNDSQENEETTDLS